MHQVLISFVAVVTNLINIPKQTTVQWDSKKNDVLVMSQIVSEGNNVITSLEKLPDATLKIVRFCGPHRCAEYHKQASDIAGGDYSDDSLPTHDRSEDSLVEEALSTTSSAADADADAE